jgi:hypothetical protein
MDALAFIREVDRTKTLGSLDNNKTASLVASKLTGEAKAWFNKLTLRETPGAYDWTALKGLMEKRFLRKLNVAEVNALFTSLNQKQGEQVATFLDRVENACLTEDIGLANNVKQEAGYENALNRKIKRLFVTGLDDRIKATMSAIDTETATIDDLMEAAIRAEVMMRTSAPAGTAAGVAAMMYRGGRGGQARGGFRGGSRGGGGRGRGGPRDLSKVSCFRCHKVGHMVKDCRVPEDKIRKDFKPRSNERTGTAAVEHEDDAKGAAAGSWAEEEEEEQGGEYLALEYRNSDDLN